MCDNVITDRDAKMNLESLVILLTIFYSKMMIFIVFDKSVTDGRTDGPTRL